MPRTFSEDVNAQSNVSKNLSRRKLDSSKGTEINVIKILGLVIHQYFEQEFFFILKSGI